LRAAEVCSAEATELPFWERPPVSVANGLCHPTRDDTVYSLVCFVSGWGNLSTISPFINPADPVDPVIRVLFPFHHIVAPNIYGGRLGLICITLPDRGLPAVILNLVRDELRMMALKPVAARDGAMKHIAECVGYFLRLSNN